MKNPNLMSTQSTSRGFTLIELLVVIAIIGILSSVVLASLNTARNRGADSAVKSNLANARAEAELYYDTTGANTYGTAGSGTGVCAVGTGTIGDNINAALDAQGRNVAARDTLAEVCFVLTGSGSWAASVPLKSDNTKFHCVDSAGLSTTTSTYTISSSDTSCS